MPKVEFTCIGVRTDQREAVRTIASQFGTTSIKAMSALLAGWATLPPTKQVKFITAPTDRPQQAEAGSKAGAQ